MSALVWILEMIREYLFAPIIITLAGVAVGVVTKYFGKMTRASSVKEELSSLEVSNSIRASVIEELDKIVKAAVATNMSFVESIKIEQRKLTDEEVNELNENARKLIMNSLPADVRQEDGKIMNIIGGPEALDALINILIEKHVYEYKPQSKKNIAEATGVWDTGENANDDDDDRFIMQQYTDTSEVVDDPEPEQEPEAEEDIPADIEETEKRVPNPVEIPDVYDRGVG